MMRAVIVFVLVVAVAGCNQRETVLDSPVSPSPPAASHLRVVSVAVSPGVVDGGRQTAGTVSLSDQAPTAGAVVSLSSSDPAATVPTSVRIPAGSSVATFTVTTRQVPADRIVVISASTPGGSASGRLAVWTPNEGTYFRFVSDPGHAIGHGEFARYTSPASSFAPGCFRNQVNLDVTSPEFHFWQMSFRASAGQPLRVGVYEGAGGYDGDDHSRPLLFFGGRNRYCKASTGRFQVHEIDLQNDRVNRFHISFEHRCLDDNGSPWLRGEVRLLDGGTPALVENCPQ